jgi:hypothetical protein
MLWSENIDPSFLTSVSSRPGRFIFGKTALGNHCIGDWVGPRGGLDVVECRRMSSPFLRIKPRPSRSQRVSIPTELSRLDVRNSGATSPHTRSLSGASLVKQRDSFASTNEVRYIGKYFSGWQLNTWVCYKNKFSLCLSN